MSKTFGIKSFEGLVSVRKELHGITVRGLNFSDISLQWQTKGKSLIDAYDKIIKDGSTADTGDVFSFINDIVTFAPDIARDIFLAAIDDDGQPHPIGTNEDTGEAAMATAAEVWEHHMGVGKQLEFLQVIIELTVSESDTLKKSFAKLTQPKMGETQTAVHSMMTS